MTLRKRLVVLAVLFSVCMSVFSFSASAANLAYGAATVSASSLNIRSEPSTDSARVRVISKGTRVVILECTSDDWYKINYNGNVGYVKTEYLMDILTVENFNAIGIVTGTSVRMREDCTVDSAVLRTYDLGDQVKIIGINNGWYKVETDEQSGYIRSDLVEITSGGAITSASSLGQDIANFALNYVGYKYVYGAESPSSGFDCSGLVYYVYGQYGYKLSRTASQQYANNGVSVSKSALQPGDLVFFSSNSSGVTHVGIYIGGDQFVHASTSTTGVIISDLTSSYYERVWYGAKRIV